MVKKTQTDIIREIDTTVWIADDGTEKIKMFFCYNCQAPIVQYKGSVISIVPGLAPSPTPVVVKCNGCKKKYCFISGASVIRN